MCSGRSSSGSTGSGEPVEKCRGHAIEISGPFVTAIKCRHHHIRARRSESRLVVGKLLRCVPIVSFAAANQRLRDAPERLFVELGWHVAAEREEPVRRVTTKRGRTKRHGDTLREAGKDV